MKLYARPLDKSKLIYKLNDLYITKDSALNELDKSFVGSVIVVLIFELEDSDDINITRNKSEIAVV